MKSITNIKIWSCLLLVAAILTSCKKFLDQEPLSDITPENYLTEESQLAAYAVGRYVDILPSHGNWSFGTFGIDGNTDNMATPTLDNRYIPGQWRVDATGGDWSFGNIYQMNYFLQSVIPRWKAGSIVGNAENINHFIGEIYFLRAFEYFKKLQSLGDFPIIKTTIPDNNALLTEASKRMPRTEVARFILSDLDSAITLLKVMHPMVRKVEYPKLQLSLLNQELLYMKVLGLNISRGRPLFQTGPNGLVLAKTTTLATNIHPAVSMPR